MFRFLDQLTPEHIEAVMAFVQMEMLEAGYATNVEFHYLHHQPGGVPYDNLGELSDRVAAAADHTGIGLTLLPVFYQYGGCDLRPLGPGQIRFGNDLTQYARLLEQARHAISGLPGDTGFGVAPHSLRAIGAENLPALTALAGDGPLHMHLAEQLPEVDEVLQAWGARPVEWLLANAEVTDRWCLIHCTQMTRAETIALAQTNAVAGLCPITEASLGDGIFDGVRWMDNAGRLAIGSDSNIRISLTEELRQLDYSQRLRDHSRAALASEDKSTGRRLFEAISAGGAQASGRDCGRIETGAWADLLSLDGGSAHLHGRSGDTTLDSFIFAGDDQLIENVWSAGRHQVVAGRHISREEITKRYLRTMDELGQAI
jgi:formimidoylglutamate deiminase